MQLQYSQIKYQILPSECLNTTALLFSTYFPLTGLFLLKDLFLLTLKLFKLIISYYYYGLYLVELLINYPSPFFVDLLLGQRLDSLGHPVRNIARR